MAPAASTGRQRYRWLLLLAAVTMLVAWLVSGGQGEEDPAVDSASTSSSTSSSPDDASVTDAASGLPVVRLAALPPEAGRTVELIDAGGPFPEERDGVTFENREDLLPDEPRGYYAEYTVPTPGSDDRGARRIVAGDGGELYWTQDHYSSFGRIVR
jgi:ribonuclease T1